MNNSEIINKLPSLIYSCAQNIKQIIQCRQIGTQPNAGHPTLYFGKDIPTATGLVHGGAIKLQRLQEHFHVSKTNCNILYLVSSSQPPYAERLIDLAKKRGVKIIWNQNGVSYPASEPILWKKINTGMIRLIHKSDYVIYQSQFCKQSADEFLGVFEGPQSVIYNNVDTNIFTPKKKLDNNSPLTILLGGNQYRKYRLETALHTVAEVIQIIPDVQLIVTGKIAWEGLSETICKEQMAKLIKNLQIKSNVQFFGNYSQHEAPEVFNKAHILLHPVHMDASPGMVLEAMASGLPVVYSKSGGTPELVGDHSGIGVDNDNNWNERVPPNPSLLADAIIHVNNSLDEYSYYARKRAVEKFNLPLFIDQHKTIFEEVLNK